jgi:putative transposase
MLKSLKIRIYLNKEQIELFNKLFGCYRFTYNQLLNYKQIQYKENYKDINSNDLSKYFHSDLVKQNKFLQEFSSHILKNSIQVIYNSYERFFKHISEFPKFKSKDDKQSVKFLLNSSISKTNLKNNKINLTTNLKEIKFETSNRDRNYIIKNKKFIKSITISKTKTNKYFAAILIDTYDKLKEIKKPENNIIGIDLGIKTLVTFSDGLTINNLKWIRSNEKKLKRLHKQLSKKQIGSNNRNKAKLKLAIAHEKIYNKKLNNLHNITSKIINENQIIVLEDLNVSGMLQNHKLAKSIQELSWSEFRRQLEYNAKENNRNLIFISQWFPSSKVCSCCGWKNNNLKLSDRIFICKECGLEIDRDLNAAINIRNEGLRIYKEQIGMWNPEFKLVDYPTMDDKTEMSLKSSDRLKQEQLLNIS